jgi:hypothetical protein
MVDVTTREVAIEMARNYLLWRAGAECPRGIAQLAPPAKRDDPQFRLGYVERILELLIGEGTVEAEMTELRQACFDDWAARCEADLDAYEGAGDWIER